MKIHEPVGVIGMACPDAYPLLGFVSLFAPAVVRGNTMIIIPSQQYPLSALDLYQVMLLTTGNVYSNNAVFTQTDKF